MAPKSNPGKLGAILSAILVLMVPVLLVTVLICIAAGHVSRAANGLPRYGSQPVNQPDRSHSAEAVPTKGEMPPAVSVPIQFKDPRSLGVGKLLVASPSLADPNFAKTVVLLIRRDDEGIVGLILNRRTDLALSQVLEGIPGTKDRSDQAYLGGPVQVAAVTALLQSPKKVEGADSIFGEVYLVSTKTLLEHTLAAKPDPQVFHVYLGYAGWSNDQLRKEVELGAWFIFPADTGVVFNSDPGSLWRQMIRKTEQKFAESNPGSAPPWPHAGPFVGMRTSPGLQQLARR